MNERRFRFASDFRFVFVPEGRGDINRWRKPPVPDSEKKPPRRGGGTSDPTRAISGGPPGRPFPGQLPVVSPPANILPALRACAGRRTIQIARGSWAWQEGLIHTAKPARGASLAAPRAGTSAASTQMTSALILITVTSIGLMIAGISGCHRLNWQKPGCGTRRE